MCGDYNLSSDYEMDTTTNQSALCLHYNLSFILRMSMMSGGANMLMNVTIPFIPPDTISIHALT